MDIKLTIDPQAACLQLQGRFDFSAHHAFRDACNKALESASKEILIDLSGVAYVDSAALGLLLLMRDKCAVSNRPLALVRPGSDVYKILGIANFPRLFDIRGVPA